MDVNNRLSEEGSTREETEPTAQPAAGAPWFRFWGVRGSIPTPGADHHRLRWQHHLCRSARRGPDHHPGRGHAACGCWARELIAEFGDEPHGTDFAAHPHALGPHPGPAVLQAAVLKPQNQLRIYGYEGARHGLDSRAEQPDGKPVLPHRPARSAGKRAKSRNCAISTFNVGPVRVQTAFANHPGICVGYRLFTPQGSIAFFPDNEPHRRPFAGSRRFRQDRPGSAGFRPRARTGR